MTKSKYESKIALKSKSNSNAVSKAISSYFPATPTPLNKPIIDKDFNDLPAIERVTEALRYNLLSIEYSISPKGGLRQWIKINLSLLLLFGIPMLILLILTPLATYLMEGFVIHAGLLEYGSKLLLMAAQNILKLIGVTTVIGTILYIIFKLL